MRIIAVNHETMPDRLAALPDRWEVWSTDQSSQITYAQIAQHGLSSGWQRDTVVVQDDIRFTVDPLLESSADIVVYGQTSKPGHVCQRAFSATPYGWWLLSQVWQGGPRQVCYAWARVIDQFGDVLDVTTHLEPVGARTKNGVVT